MPFPVPRSASAKLEIAAQVAIWAARIATSYQVLYLVWFHRDHPSSLFVVINAMWFVLPLAAWWLASAATRALRRDRSDPDPGGEVRRTSCWMLAVSLLQFPLRIPAPFWDRTLLELVTVGGIVAIRALNFGPTRWIGPAAVAVFMAWLPFATVAAGLDGGAYLANVLVAAALVVHAGFGFLETRVLPPSSDAPEQPRPEAAPSPLGTGYRAAVAIAACCQIAAIGWLASELGGYAIHLLNPFVLIAMIAQMGGLIAALVWAALALVSRFVFRVRREPGAGGARRRAMTWLVLAFALACTAVFDEAGAVVQSALVVAAIAVRDLRRPAPAWIVPTVVAGRHRSGRRRRA